MRLGLGVKDVKGNQCAAEAQLIVARQRIIFFSIRMGHVRTIISPISWRSMAAQRIAESRIQAKVL